MKVHLLVPSWFRRFGRGLTEDPNPGPNTNHSWGELILTISNLWMMFVHFWCPNPKLSIHLKRLRPPWIRLSGLAPDTFPTLWYSCLRGPNVGHGPLPCVLRICGVREPGKVGLGRMNLFKQRRIFFAGIIKEACMRKCPRARQWTLIYPLRQSQRCEFGNLSCLLQMLCKCAPEFHLSHLKRNSCLIKADSGSNSASSVPLRNLETQFFGCLAREGGAARRKQVSFWHRRWRIRQQICMKIPAKQQSDSASKHAILSRPFLIEKKEQDGSFHTRDAWPLRYFLAPCWHAIFFFHSGFCVSLHWLHYLFTSRFLASPVLGLLCCE